MDIGKCHESASHIFLNYINDLFEQKRILSGKYMRLRSREQLWCKDTLLLLHNCLMRLAGRYYISCGTFTLILSSFAATPSFDERGDA